MLKIKECKALARRTLLGRYGTVIGAYFVTTIVGVILWIMAAVCGIITLYASGVLNGLFGTGIAFSFPKLAGGIMATFFIIAAAVIVSLWFEIGSTRLMLNICRGRKYGIGDIFYGFGEGADAFSFILTGIAIALMFMAVNLVQKVLFFAAELLLGGHTMLELCAELVISLICLIAAWYISTSFMFAKILIADKRESGVGAALAASHRLMKGRKLKGFWLIYLSFMFWYVLAFFCAPAMLWIAPYITCTTVIFYMEADGTLWQLPGAEINGGSDQGNEAAINDAQGTEASADNMPENAAAGNEAAEAGAGTADTEVTGNAAQDNAADDVPGAEAQEPEAQESESAEPEAQSNGTPAAEDKDASASDSDSISSRHVSFEEAAAQMNIEMPEGFRKTGV